MAGTAMLMFITGGVRSGKSSYAEKRAVEQFHNEKGSLYYLATGLAEDNEMKERVKKHQRQRSRISSHWNVIEQSIDVEEHLPSFNQRDVVLIDCLTTLLTNELFKDWRDVPDKWKDPAYVMEIETKLISFINELARGEFTAILVSNEVSHEPISDELTLAYAKLLGTLHQHAVKESVEAIKVEAGIPIVMKGRQ
jgi:adenosylcobinamide kinase/adenosylcobinamide-phosphate guanylyltransferase